MKELYVPDATYIVAVSGGVDSMALLHMLKKHDKAHFIVAHVNHGLRADAHLDQELVAATAAQYGLPCEVMRANLPVGANEAMGREVRYTFFHSCRIKYGAKAILTAHHQNDVIETVILNILRGTGWRGLAPFAQKSFVRRPLLEWQKHELIGYARKHGLAWREDSTNSDEAFTRNYIRHTIIPLLDQKSLTWQADFLRLIRRQQQLRKITEKAFVEIFSNNATMLQRHNLIMQEPSFAQEFLRTAITTASGHTLTRPQTEKALLFTKVATVGKRHSLNKQWQLRATRREVIVEPHPLVVS